MIDLRDVERTYRVGALAVPVLRQLSLRIERGEFVAIMGPSGSGKSTLLNLIGCLDRLDAGSYRLAGVEVAQLPDAALATVRARRIGFVFQGFNLLGRMNAQRNVELPMSYAGVPRAQRGARALALLQRVGLEQRATHLPTELSGGQQQRVAIARALVNDPNVIVADEPTGSLDSATGDAIMTLFADLNRTGATIVMVTHEPALAARASRTVHLRDGRIVQDSAGPVP